MPNVNGLHLMLPTSVSAVGSSNSITLNPNGSVSFTNCTDVNLNGVFTDDYENYIILLVADSESADGGLGFRLRSSGTDNATANSYYYQFCQANGTAETGGANPGDRGVFTEIDDLGSCTTWYIYGPKLAQPTAFRSLGSKYRSSGIRLYDFAGTHNQSVGYDGVSIILNALGTRFNGKVAVYGMRK